MANLSDRVRAKIEGTGGLLPVGAIVAYSPGYYTATANGGSFNVVGPGANTVAQVNSYLPPEWRVCDGTAPNDPESLIFNAAGRFMPDITGQRFIRGHTAAGAVGGAAGNAITLNAPQLPTHDHPAGTLAADLANAPHSHPASTTVNAANAPHDHQPGSSVSAANAPHSHYQQDPTAGGGGPVIGIRGNVPAPGIYASGPIANTNVATDVQNAPHSHGLTIATDNAPHAHTASTTVSANNAPHSHSVSGTTGSIGAGNSVDITPQYINVFYIMRIK